MFVLSFLNHGLQGFRVENCLNRGLHVLLIVYSFRFSFFMYQFFVSESRITHENIVRITDYTDYSDYADKRFIGKLVDSSMYVVCRYFIHISPANQESTV